jgi:hypothetical protein
VCYFRPTTNPENMRSTAGQLTLFTCAVSLFILGSSLSGCSGCGAGSTTDGTDTTGSATGAANGANTDGSAAGGSANAGGHGSDSASHMDTRSTDLGTGAAAGTIVLTPAEERTKTGDEMRGLRAILKTELDGVRASLGKGGTPEEKEANKTRAAELAQGLERIDRAIKAIDESTDVSWGTIRESQLKEAGEVRAWMAKYGMNVAS